MKIILLIICHSLIAVSLAQQVNIEEIPTHYRRGIETPAGYQSYNQKYFGKNLSEEKRSLFPLASTGVWTELNPKVPRVDYIGVDFINPDIGWAVGLWGAAIKTTNGGTSWQTLETPTGEILLKVSSFNGQVVVAVGHNGTIIRSSDGGENFTLLTGITTQELWGVKMLNDTLGWICGRNQTLIKTTDAGLTWQPIVTGFNYHYWSFNFLPAPSGTEDYFMIACSQGKVLKTTNGGQSFTQHQAGSTQDLYTIDIIDSLHIAAAGNIGKNVYSSDGGNTWTENQYTALSINWIQYISRDTGYITIGTISSFYKTTNRGQSWFNPGFNETGEWQFELIAETIGYGVGAGLTVTKSEDGFNTGYNLFLNKNWSDVFFVNEMKGFFASAALDEKLNKTEDGGITYEVIENSPEWNYDILFLDSLVGFSGSSTIYKTTDGGENWYATNGAGQATNIFFINTLTGWAVGSNIIYKTIDGGENWITQFTHISDSFTSIFFVDSLNGWATSRYVHQTTDGGLSWIERTDIQAFFSKDIFFIDSVGYVIEFLKLYKSTNSGNTWFTQLNSQYIIRSFGWVDNQKGFIIGDGVYETTNRGENWEEILDLRNVGLRKFHAPLNYLGYAVGNQGLIYKYIDSSYVPVELISFTGLSADEKVLLEWQTASEINNMVFEVQKSKDKENWQLIGFVHGSGSSTENKSYSYTDNSTIYEINYYRLKQIDYDGSFTYSKIIEVNVDLTPKEFVLHQNYPNPFNPTTKIKFTIPTVETYRDASLHAVSLKVYDILCNEVATLVNETKPVGTYEVEFNAVGLASGIYFYQLKAGSFTSTKKLILLK